MDFRNSVENIVEYIEGRSEEIYREILLDNPNFKRTIELSFADNIQCVRSELREQAHAFPETDDLIDNPDDTSRGRFHCSDYMKLPACTDTLFDYHERAQANEANRKWMRDNPPSYPQFKKFLRNMLLWNYQSARYTSEFHYSDKQFRAAHRISGTIKLVESKLTATVWLEAQDEDGNYGEKYEVYSLPALKLSKFLKKIECSDKFITRVAAKISNVPKTLTLCFTDQYIPECYIAMAGRVSSCMAYNSDSFGIADHEHPTLAYEGSPDVILALVKDEDSDSEFPFINRAIVLRENWGYDTSYGNQLMHDLTPFGLDSGADMSGIRLSYIESDRGGVLAPYVDGTDCRFYESRGYLVCCDDNGSRQSCYDTGRLGGEYYCDWCDGYYDDIYDTYESGDVCENCLENHFVEVAGYGHVLYDNTTAAEDSDGYSIRVRDCEAVYSDYHSTYLHEDAAYYSDKCQTYLRDSDNENDVFREMNDCDNCCRCNDCGDIEEDEC